MKRIFKGFTALVLSAVLLAAFAVTALGATAAAGDIIVLTVSVEGVNNMGSMTVQIDYDKTQLDLLSEDTLQGMGVANTTVDGQILWAALFDPAGSDFSKKTDVYSVEFVAKQNLADINSIIQFQVKDAYNAEVNSIDTAHVVYSVMLEDNNDTQSSTSSEVNTNENSASEDTNNATASQNTSKTDFAQSKLSSDTSSKNDTNSKLTENSSNFSSATSGDKIISSEKDTESAAEAEKTESLIETYDESEFEQVPPIKLDTQDTADRNNGKGSFPVGAVIAIAVCLVIAAVGTVVLIVKRKKQ